MEGLLLGALATFTAGDALEAEFIIEGVALEEAFIEGDALEEAFIEGDALEEAFIIEGDALELGAAFTLTLGAFLELAAAEGGRI
jgi:hypothetical protein